MKVTSRVVSSSSRKTMTSYRQTPVKQKNHEKKSTPKAPKKSSSKKSSGSFAKAMTSPTAIKIYGLLMILFSFLLLVSIISFYCHAHNNVAFVVSDGEVVSENIARKIGAWLSYFFVNNIFGVFSIGFPFLFFLYGLGIFGKKPLPLFRTTISTVLTMSWLSITFGIFFANGDNSFVSGMFGNFISTFLLEKTGKFITAIIVIALLGIILISCYETVTRALAGAVMTGCQSAVSGISNMKNEEQKERRSRKERKRGKHDGEEETSEHEDLDDLYISTRNELGNEYRKNVIEFDEPEHSHQQHLASTEEFLGKKPKTEVMEEVPFELTSSNLHKPEETQPQVVAEAEEIVEEQQTSETEAKVMTAEDVHNLEPYDPKKELSTYEFPPISLLNEYPAKEAAEEHMRRELLENKRKIETTLKSFNIPIKKITATVGPTVTLYEIVPDDGVRISKIKNLEDDIALSLAALGIRIIAPIPGKGTIGIEVPNKNANTVSMREIITSDRFQNNNFALPIGLGKTISNEPFVVDLAKMPHLLVAGATGQGKSVGLNAIITSLLYTKHPTEMKFVLVDPKKVEFTLYSVIENYYLAKLPNEAEAIITDTKKVVNTLNALCKEMDDRYDLLKLAKLRNIKEYNAKFCARGLSPAMGHRYMPYIVLIVDEFGDLIMTAGREVEQPLARLAQLARAIGIHLVIATQRPSVNIITGSIKANFPARIAFRVASKIDSRTILDAGGADQLIGKGDMLISTGSDLIRLQCAFVDTPEVEKIAEYIAQKSELSPLAQPYELPEPPVDATDKDNFDDDAAADSGEIDPLFVDAAVLIVQTQQGSTSFIQRRMKLGYNRAGRIMDQLAEFGIVGQANGSKPREVLIKTSAQLQELLAAKGML